MCQASFSMTNFYSDNSQSNKRLVLRTLFHFIQFCVFWFVSCYGGYMIYTSAKEEFDDQTLRDLIYLTPLFLTNWNFLFQTVFLSLALLYDVLEWFDKNHSNFGRKLKFARDVLFCSWVLPVTLFISSMFWCVYWIDRELVFPRVYDQVVPWWFNQCVHTNILVVIVVETLLQPRRHPTHFKLELYGNIFITVLYAIIYYTLYFITKRWLYGVFGVMTWWQVCLFQILIWASCFFFYFIQFPINRLIHKEDSDLQVGEKCGIYDFGNIVNMTNGSNDSLNQRSVRIDNSVL